MDMTINLLGSYRNGNYDVTIFSDGTKIRENDLDFFEAQFPENIDLKITDYCDVNCAFCHENSTVHGEHSILDAEFFRTLRPYTELAIGGGNPLSHPELIPFLINLKKSKILANLTVNQVHFEKHYNLLKHLMDKELIRGLGVSLVNPTDKFISMVQSLDNLIIHTINGIISKNQISKLYDKNLKVLILGYKNIRRGKDYYSESVDQNIEMMYNLLKYGLTEHFEIVSFDNLALNQLRVKSLISKSLWDEFYMGDDGQHTMYIDLVKREFSKSSTCFERHPLMDDIDNMFAVVKTIK